MEATNTVRKTRTKEEVVLWLERAIQRKEAFEHEVQAKWAARQAGLKEAAASHYYDLEWQ